MAAAATTKADAKGLEQKAVGNTTFPSRGAALFRFRFTRVGESVSFWLEEKRAGASGELVLMPCSSGFNLIICINILTM